MVDSHPLDMSTKDDFIPSPPPPPSPPGVSPPPLTKIVKKTPSSPREFFAKLYGPDTNQDTDMNSHNPPQDNLKTSLDFPPHVPSLDIHPYLPAYSLPPHQAGMISFETLPFPAGLAAFCKYNFVQQIL